MPDSQVSTIVPIDRVLWNSDPRIDRTVKGSGTQQETFSRFRLSLPLSINLLEVFPRIAVRVFAGGIFVLIVRINADDVKK